MLRAGTGRRGPFSGALVSPTAAAISCAFPLTYTGLGAFGLLEPTVSADGQTITQALTAGTNTWAAASFTQTVPAGADVTVVRLKIDALPLMAADGSEGAARVKLALYEAGPLEGPGIAVLATISGTYTWQVTAPGQPTAGDALASLPAYLDMRLRAAAGTFDVALPDGTLLAVGVSYTVGALNPLLSITGSGVAGTGIGKTVSCSFVTAASTLADSPFAQPETIDACGNLLVEGGDPRWADVLMLVDFTGKDGLTSVTDAKNGDIYTLRGAAFIASDQLVMQGAGFADTPDSPSHDPGTAPDTVEFLDFEVNNSAGGFQAIASNYDGASVALTIQRDGQTLYYNTASGAVYGFGYAAGGLGWVLGQHYHIAFTRSPEGVLNLWVDGQKHPTEYTGVAANVIGSTSKWTFGRLPEATGITQYFVGRFRAFRLTDGAPRHTADFVPPPTFPHSA